MSDQNPAKPLNQITPANRLTELLNPRALLFSQGGKTYLANTTGTAISLLEYADAQTIEMPHWLRAEIHQAGLLLGAIANPRTLINAIDGAATTGTITPDEAQFNRTLHLEWLDETIAKLKEAREDIAAGTTAPAKKWYAITGRIPGDDDDSVYVCQAENEEEAKAGFEPHMYGNKIHEAEFVRERHGESIYIIHTLVSETEIKEI